MKAGEFTLIKQYFDRPVPEGFLGVGDDAAILSVPLGQSLVVCKDMLVQGRHFVPDVSAHSLGHKSLAVNLSDLAAMGAKPLGFLLGLGVPKAEHAWLSEYALGLHALADQTGCPLIGGDTVCSQDIVISITALGTLPQGHPGLRRNAAQAGDDIWISGVLGAADVALQHQLGQITLSEDVFLRLRQYLDYPTPRLALGQGLLGLAHAAIDISDGLLQDLSHVLNASGCGAELVLADVPIHPDLACLSFEKAQIAALQGGDVYELCFTAPAGLRDQIDALGLALSVQLTRIGQIQAQPGLFGLHGDGQLTPLAPEGFDHFAHEHKDNV
jgi:thiamine-monophosphate kinase